MIKFPFMNGQQLNLDWIMQQLRAILNFMPTDQGAVGDVLQRGTNGATWQPLTSVVYDIDGMDTAAEVTASDEIPIYDVSAQGNYKTTVQDILDLTSVSSVNGQTGAVVLDASDVGALPDDYTPTFPVTSVNGQTGDVVLDASDVGALPSTYTAPVTSVNGQTGAVVISTGQAAPTLLWTNERPTQDFTGQSLSLSLSTYNFIIIEYATHYMNMKTAIFHVPDIPEPAGYSVYDEISGLYVSGSNYKLCTRRLQISTSGIVFEGGTRIDAYASGNSSDNEVCRPTRIWGL